MWLQNAEQVPKNFDMELSRRCSLTLRRCKNCSLHAVRRVSNWSRLLGASSTFLRPNESTRIRGVCCARRRAGPPHGCSARNHGCGARNHRSAARMLRAQPSVPLEHQHENSSTSLRPSRAHAAAGGLSESRLISYTFRGVSCNISSFHWYIPGICLSYVISNLGFMLVTKQPTFKKTLLVTKQPTLETTLKSVMYLP